MISPVKAPRNAYDWLTHDELLGHALAAYYAASRDMEPPEGEPFISPDTGQPWVCRGDFLETLTTHLTDRLHRLYEERVIHKSTAACAEGVPAFLRAVATEGSCGPCG